MTKRADIHNQYGQKVGEVRENPFAGITGGDNYTIHNKYGGQVGGIRKTFGPNADLGAAGVVILLTIGVILLPFWILYQILKRTPPVHWVWVIPVYLVALAGGVVLLASATAYKRPQPLGPSTYPPHVLYRSPVWHGRQIKTLLYQHDWRAGPAAWPDYAGGWTDSHGSLSFGGGDSEINADYQIPAGVQNYEVDARMRVPGFVDWEEDGVAIVVRAAGDTDGFNVMGAKGVFAGSFADNGGGWYGIETAKTTYDANHDDSLEDSSWHDYKLQVHGNDMRLIVDGQEVAASSVSEYSWSRQIGVAVSGNVQVRYFRVYALRTVYPIAKGATRRSIVAAIQGSNAAFVSSMECACNRRLGNFKTGGNLRSVLRSIRQLKVEGQHWAYPQESAVVGPVRMLSQSIAAAVVSKDETRSLYQGKKTVESCRGPYRVRYQLSLNHTSWKVYETQILGSAGSCS